MKKLSKKVRLEVYKKMLIILNEGYYNWPEKKGERIPFKPEQSLGFCRLITCSCVELEMGWLSCYVESYDELMEYKPFFNEDGDFWFDRHDRDIRRKILTEIIDKMKEDTFFKRLHRILFGN